MRFQITIDCDNAAFGADRDYELGRILRGAAKKIETGEGPDPMIPTRARLPLYDSNDNRVGEATFPRG